MSEKTPQPAQTAMRLHAGIDWRVHPDTWVRDEDIWTRTDNQGRPVTTLRRVGWLDQKGRVWTEIPDGRTFDGGSLTPLLIDAREDGH